MGAGPSQIDYKERNFTKQPLTDEEIDVLIKSIPKDDVLGSLNQEDKEMIMNNYPVNDLIQRLEQPEKEKIVKAMSNEKMFNLRGDSIFDYYFTNNKSELKSCMKGHINKDGTLCEDEKFKRMITTMPDLVMGPLREKQSQWDTEKNTLQTQWDTEKNTLQTQWVAEKTNLEAQWGEEKTNLEAQWGEEKKGLEAQNKSLIDKKTTLEEQLKKLKNIEAPKTMVTHEGKQDYSMTALDCFNYANATGSEFNYHDRDQQKSPKKTGNPRGYQYYITEEGEVGKDHLSGADCEKYAEKNNLEYEGNLEVGVSSPGACRLKDNKVSYNMTVGGWENYADCSPTEKCIKMKQLRDRVGGCIVYNARGDGNADKQVRYYNSKYVTDICSPQSNELGKQHQYLCVKKWKDYKPDESDTTNFNKNDYKEYSPFSDYVDKVKPILSANNLNNYQEAIASETWDTLRNDDKDSYKEAAQLRDDIRNNIEHISENECRLYAGEDASKYFVRNDSSLPLGCVRQKTMRNFSAYVPGPDPDFNKIFYNHADKQIFQKNLGFIHNRATNIKYYDKESDSFKEHKIKEYEPRFTTIVKK